MEQKDDIEDDEKEEVEKKEIYIYTSPLYIPLVDKHNIEFIFNILTSYRPLI